VTHPELVHELLDERLIPHAFLWDHLLWSTRFGDAPRYGTARGAADIQAFLSNPDWRDEIAEELPPEIDVPLELLGQIAGLPIGATHIPGMVLRFGSSSITRTWRGTPRW
jgi:hypothetical protein